MLSKVTCYTRHLDEVFEDLGLEKTSDNKKKLELMIREKLDLKEEAHCEELGRKIKEITNNWTEMEDLINLLKQ